MTTLPQRFDGRHHQLFDLPLPNGVSMKVCCDSALNCHADDRFGNVCWFHTSLFFPIDDAISTYLEARDKYSAEQNYPLTAKEEMVVLDGVEHYPLGYLTTEIRVGSMMNVDHDEPIELPTSAVTLLLDILGAMASGQGVTIIPEDAELTIVQSANIFPNRHLPTMQIQLSPSSG